MSPDFSKAVLESLFPKGASWDIITDEDLDLLLDGIAKEGGIIEEFLLGLSQLRKPLETSLLPDLEKEFGVFSDDNLTETLRRQKLQVDVFATDRSGSEEAMQNVLSISGFSVTVYQNNPAVDPALFSGELLTNRTTPEFSVPTDSTTWPMIFFVAGTVVRSPVNDEITTLNAATVDADREEEFKRLILKHKPLHTWAYLNITYV